MKWKRRLVTILLTGLLWGMNAGITGAEGTEKPILGVCIVQTDSLRAEKNNKPGDMLREAVYGKIPPGIYQMAGNINDGDFISYLGRKDILLEGGKSSNMLKELRLPIFGDYGKARGVDYLVVVIGDASVSSHMATRVNEYTDPSTHKTHVSTYDELSVDYADVTLRAVMVDVKKNEYVFNTLISVRSGGPDMWGNPVRSVINDGMKKALNEFGQKVTIQASN